MPNPNKIDFCIVGAQKSASSSLAELLARSSQLFMPKLEQHFFETPFYERGELEEFLNSIPNKRTVGIKRPDYLCKKGIPERLYAHNDKMKIIVTLRDPIDRFVSAAFWYMQVGLIPIMDINELIERLQTSAFKDKYKKSNELLEYGLYGAALKRYLSVFPKSQILVIEDKRIHFEAENTANIVLSFLNKNQITQKSSAKSIQKKPAIYSKPRLKFISLLNKNLFFKIHENEDYCWLELRSKFSRAIFRALKLIDTAVAPIIRNEKPSLNSTSLEILKKYYQSDQKELKQIIKINKLKTLGFAS